MSDRESSGPSLSDLARQRRAELAQPHPADVEASRLRQELAETETALRGAQRGARLRGVATREAERERRRQIGKAYAASRRRQKQVSQVEELITQRDRALRNVERWRWIALTQKRDPEFGLTALGVSLEAERERADRAGAESARLRTLLQDSQERLRRAEEGLEELTEYRGRFFEATAQIEQLQTELVSATAYAQGVERWMLGVAEQLSGLLPQLGPPPTLSPPPPSE